MYRSFLPPQEQLVHIADWMHELISELYPICRSITGNGFRSTLRAIEKHLPLTVHEVPSGSEVFDWTVPKEWNIRDAYIKDPTGRRVVDFQQSNLHVVNYSTPINRRMTLQDLRPHLHTLPDKPDWIPYRTTYYNEDWGFCLSHSQFLALEDVEYEVCIDSSLEPGSLTYGETLIPGAISDEVLISCHACHPSLANDNLSGIAVATFLAQYLRAQSLKHSFRFLFIPGTIGSVTWLSQNEAVVPRIKHGLVLTCLGDSGMSTYKRSRRGNTEIDRAAEHILKQSGQAYEIQDFFPYGYDERQYCSPGFNLAVGCFTRTPHGRFPEYHTSADNLEFVRPEYLADSFAKTLGIVNVIEHNARYINTNPKCEPQLGKRGLYDAVGGQSDTKTRQLAMLWVLNLSDGEHSLLDIAERAGMPFRLIHEVAQVLRQHELLHVVHP